MSKAALQADVAALRNLIKIVHSLAPDINDVSLGTDTALGTNLRYAFPAIERLLGIVSGVEKLEASYREAADVGSASPENMGPRQFTAHKLFLHHADDLKALLDREK